MIFEQEHRQVFGHQNEYRSKASAIDIARKTGGEFIDKEFHDNIGSYWIVIWRAK